MYKCTCNDCGRDFTTFDPSWWCDDCEKKRFQKHQEKKPQTNADRIRAMSDEELAEDYCKTILKVMQYYGIKNTGILEDAVRARLEWLKQPAEE